MLKKQLYADQIQALKNKDQEKLTIIRYILAQIKNKEIEKRSHEPIPDNPDLTEDEIILVLKKIAKQIKESIEAFKKGKRDDLVFQHQNQLEIVTSYLPKP